MEVDNMLEMEYHRVKKLRESLGYSLKEFAYLLGITGADMYEYETEKIMSYEMIEKIKNLDCGNGQHINIDWLQTGDGTMFLE